MKTESAYENCLGELPVARTSKGAHRRTGVEIEFAGRSENEAAENLQTQLGGEVVAKNTHSWMLEGSEIGDLRIELDTAMTKPDTGRLGARALDLVRSLVPVEIITPPLDKHGLRRLDAALHVLRDCGAIGSRDGLFLGFGVHLNPEVVAENDAFTLRTIRAFALLDPWLRDRFCIDITRRVLPFLRPWPAGFVSSLAQRKPDTLAAVIELADEHVRTRNHALDLLPLFKSAEPGLFQATYPDESSTSARPTFHFRLPDSRIDEPGWSLHEPWEMWCLVERCAADTDLLTQLESAWLDHVTNHEERANKRWLATVGDLLGNRKE
ncbi:MAG: amidoligase family protein [Pseudomonadota bacterium]